MTINLPFYQVDAFSSEPFGGNPAAVILCPEDLSNEKKQKIAAENNLAETAFLVPHPDHTGPGPDVFQSTAHFKLCWFTPTTEVPLCGHATLAAAAALFQERGNTSAVLSFHTLSGILTVTQELEMSLPLADPCDPPPPGCGDINGPLARACTGSLKVSDVKYTSSRNLNYLLMILEEGTTREQLEAIQPDLKGMEMAANQEDVHGVIVALHAGGKDGYDFLSRFFAPWMGIEEDHVTGSAHTVLGPYFQSKLGKSVMRARQCSRRGGDVGVRVDLGQGEVVVSGKAVVVIRGTMVA